MTNCKDGKGILIVDAGGGTIDISAYKKVSPKDPSFEEIAPPQCVLCAAHISQGSMILTRYSKALSKVPFS